MENVKIAKICGFCAGCKYALATVLKSLETENNVCIFKEIVHNENVIDKLRAKGVQIKDDLCQFNSDDLVIFRAHGEPPSSYEYLNSKHIRYIDCTCVNVKNIHEKVQKYSDLGYKIIIIGKYGKFSGKPHPEITGTIGWCKSPPILIEDEEDIAKLHDETSDKFYLVCQTTFNLEKARAFAEKIEEICKAGGKEIVINLSICNAQRSINISSKELSEECDLMFVVGSKKSSNTLELYNNLSQDKTTFFVEDTDAWRKPLIEAGITLSKDIKIGITAGASADPEELVEMKEKIEKTILEENMNINVNKHSSIQIDDIFIDPYLISNKSKKAKYILITHPHYDHLSVEDIDKVVLPDTVFVAPKDAKETLERRYGSHKIHYVSPNEKLTLDDFSIETFPAYNTNKQFHQKDYGWVGYKIEKDGVSYYICGDTDITLELETVKCDVLFIPIGGTFTMDALEASRITNKIEPKIVVPVHYGSIVGNKKDAETFASAVNKNIEVKIFI